MSRGIGRGSGLWGKLRKPRTGGISTATARDAVVLALTSADCPSVLAVPLPSPLLPCPEDGLCLGLTVR